MDATLTKLTPDQCQSEYPVKVGGRRVRTADFLTHLVAHLAYHVGQIDYHRRILDPLARPVDAVSLDATEGRLNTAYAGADIPSIRARFARARSALEGMAGERE